MEFCVSIADNHSIVCTPESPEVSINNKNTLITRYFFRTGNQTGCVNTFESGFLVFDKDKWVFYADLDNSVVLKQVKRIITREVVIKPGDFYKFYLPRDYLDLPNVYALDVLQPALQPRNQNIRKKRKIECWFCMSSQHFNKSLMTHIFNQFYITAAKGPMNATHGLIIPIDHIEINNDIPNVAITELQLLLKHLAKVFQVHGLTIIFWIVKKNLTEDRLHEFISFIGIDDEMKHKLPRLKTSNFTLEIPVENTAVFMVDDELKMIENPRFFDLVAHLFTSGQQHWKSRMNEKLQKDCINFISTIPSLY